MNDHRCHVPELEKALIERAQADDPAALEQLIGQHMPLIRCIAGRLCHSSCILDELEQSGIVGLLKAIRRYNTDSNAKLATYAFTWITGEMKSVLRLLDAGKTSAIPYEDEYGMPFGEQTAHESLMLSHVDLHLALERLDKETRLLVYLRYYRDRTQKQTAVLLRKSQAQISKMEKAALDTLRDILR